jgi:hypothetical protein
MTDTPSDDTPTAADAPTAEAPAADTAPGTAAEPTTEMPPAPDGSPMPPPTTAPPAHEARRGVFVPLWSLLVVGGLALLGLGFLWGHAVGDDDGPGAAFDRSRSMARGGPDGSDGRPGPRFGPFGPSGPGAGGETPGTRPDGGDSSPSPAPRGSAFLGVGVTDSTDPAGAELVRVVAESPAADAGLERGDVVTAVDGDTIADADALSSAIGGHDAGDEVEISYSRDGRERTITVTLGDRNEATDRATYGPQ